MEFSKNSKKGLGKMDQAVKCLPSMMDLSLIFRILRTQPINRRKLLTPVVASGKSWRKLRRGPAVLINLDIQDISDNRFTTREYTPADMRPSTHIQQRITGS